MTTFQKIQRPHFRHAQTLMVQGTTSDAGKSILVTALCRILARTGLHVAPFKPQNMALNSAVTAEGGEIGRAQAVQAEACYLAPTVDMNPVLLKPNSEVGSQVILRGQSIGNMQATEYHAYKPKLLNEVLASHTRLSEHYDAVIVEGAGSPAEINLREHDIANMGFAEAVDCPVIIVADIDRGGVFAHLFGTYELLSDTEKQRVIGFVINRFRGDVSLLQSGLDWLEQKTQVPVLGVLPYIQNLHIEAEDAVNNEQVLDTAASQLRVVVPMYPRASNHTDFDALRMHPQVHCEFVRDSQQFKGADLIVLPGSKNVRGDLAWLMQHGWGKHIVRHLRLGGKVYGICGGFQMLGQWVHDPEAIESTAGSSKGLGLLEMETTLEDLKQLRNVEGVFDHKGAYKSGHCKTSHKTQEYAISGYEIHAGVSCGNALNSPLYQITSRQGVKCQSEPEGACSEDGAVIGSYLHGIFDKAESLEALLEWAGLAQLNRFDYRAHRAQEIDRLADEVEQVIDANAIKALLSLELVAEANTNDLLKSTLHAGSSHAD